VRSTALADPASLRPPLRERLHNLATHCGVEDWIQSHYDWLVMLTVVVLVLNEVMEFGADPKTWDYLLISGTLTFLVGLRLARAVRPRLLMAIDRLVTRGALEPNESKLTDLRHDLGALGDEWAHRSGVLIGVATIVAYVSAYSDHIASKLPFTLVSAFGAYVAGHYLGRAAAYGRLGVLIKRVSITMNAEPEHLDGTAGFKPVGDFFFWQATLAAIPAGFLAVWWVIITVVPEYYDRYGNWLDAYLSITREWSEDFVYAACWRPSAAERWSRAVSTSR